MKDYENYPVTVFYKPGSSNFERNFNDTVAASWRKENNADEHLKRILLLSWQSGSVALILKKKTYNAILEKFSIIKKS